jgi:hypothetical protein
VTSIGRGMSYVKNSGFSGSILMSRWPIAAIRILFVEASRETAESVQDKPVPGCHRDELTC